MTTRALFQALCTVTSDIAGEADRLRFSPAKLALTAIVARLDHLIDRVIEEGIRDEEPPRKPRRTP